MSTRRRATIGYDPLDAVVPSQEPRPEERPEAPAVPSPGLMPAAEVAFVAPVKSKERLTVHLPVALIERVKNTVYWTPGLTLASLAEKSLEALVDQLEAERGEPYPRRGAELKGGRPLK